MHKFLSSWSVHQVNLVVNDEWISVGVHYFGPNFCCIHLIRNILRVQLQCIMEMMQQKLDQNCYYLLWFSRLTASSYLSIWLQIKWDYSSCFIEPMLTVFRWDSKSSLLEVCFLNRFQSYVCCNFFCSARSFLRLDECHLKGRDKTFRPQEKQEIDKIGFWNSFSLT